MQLVFIHLVFNGSRTKSDSNNCHYGVVKNEFRNHYPSDTKNCKELTIEELRRIISRPVEEISIELDLVEILKNSIGEIFYSTIYGDVVLVSVNSANNKYPITLRSTDDSLLSTTSSGLHHFNKSGECTIFPSKENRDWSTYKPKWVPNKGDRVWVRSQLSEEWHARYFSHISGEKFYCFSNQSKEGSFGSWSECKPFNEIPW